MQIFRQPKICNKPMTTLSRYQISNLLQGIKFTPTPPRNNVRLKSGKQNFSQKLRLAYFFDNTSKNAFEKNIASCPLIKNKSKFYSLNSRYKELDQHIDSLKDLHI